MTVVVHPDSEARLVRIKGVGWCRVSLGPIVLVLDRKNPVLSVEFVGQYKPVDRIPVLRRPK